MVACRIVLKRNGQRRRRRLTLRIGHTITRLWLTLCLSLCIYLRLTVSFWGGGELAALFVVSQCIVLAPLTWPRTRRGERACARADRRHNAGDGAGAGDRVASLSAKARAHQQRVRWRHGRAGSLRSCGMRTWAEVPQSRERERWSSRRARRRLFYHQVFMAAWPGRRCVHPAIVYGSGIGGGGSDGRPLCCNKCHVQC